jgi:hypothetical protein
MLVTLPAPVQDAVSGETRIEPSATRVPSNSEACPQSPIPLRSRPKTRRAGRLAVDCNKHGADPGVASLNRTHWMIAVGATATTVIACLAMVPVACGVAEKQFVPDDELNPTEICSNGVDDDGDGLTDCQDTTRCQCMSLPPDDWRRFYALAEVASGQALPPCPRQLPTAETSGPTQLDVPPTQCSPCACAPPRADRVLDCEVQLTFWNPEDCSNTQRNTLVAGSGQCVNGRYDYQYTCDSYDGWGNCTSASNKAPYASVKVETIHPVLKEGGPGCEVDGGVATHDKAQWTKFAQLCGTGADQADSGSAKGCGSGQICAPKVHTQGYGQGLCVYKQGAVPCPGYPYEQSWVIRKDVNKDTRDCTRCSCSEPHPTCPAGVITRYLGAADSQHCTGTPADAGLPTETCSKIPFVADHAYRLDLKGDAGVSCTPSATQPIGGVTASDLGATTVCCAAE